MKIHKKLAKPISYDGKKRNRKDVKFIIIHYTGNKGDTARGNALYFANSNTRQAGAHFFVDKNGSVWRSIPMNRTAWAVGGDQRSGKAGEATYYNKCTNYNSVSIELCDSVDGYGKKQAKAVKDLIKYIKKYCPNAKNIIRHWDVNGKNCPAPMVGKDNKMWKQFLKEIK